MIYQPEVKKLLDMINSADGKSIEEMTIQENREGLKAFYKDLRGER
ncbi:hypothetical protein [Oceanobacillus sp. CF4.6]